MENDNNKILAAAYNLLMQADLNGLKGQQVPEAGAQIMQFQQLIQQLVEGTLEIVPVATEGEDS